MAPTRSPMFTNPAPLPFAPVDVEPGPVVGHLEEQGAGLLPHPHGRTGVGAGVLAGVLQRLQAAEVDSRLDLGRSGDPARPPRPAWAGRRGRRRNAGPPRCPGRQQRRVDAVGQGPEFLHRVWRPGAELVEDLEGRLRGRSRPACGPAGRSRPAPPGAAGRRRAGCARSGGGRRRRRPRCGPGTPGARPASGAGLRPGTSGGPSRARRCAGPGRPGGPARSASCRRRR